MVEAAHIIGRTAYGALQQMCDGFLRHGIALAQGAAFKFPEPVERKKRVVALAAEVTVPGRAFPIRRGWG